MLYTTNLNNKFQAMALEAAVYIYNKTPHNSLNFKTSYEIKYSKLPKLDHIKIWGFIVYNKIYNIKKLDSRAKLCLLINYNES